MLSAYKDKPVAPAVPEPEKAPAPGPAAKAAAPAAKVRDLTVRIACSVMTHSQPHPCCAFALVLLLRHNVEEASSCHKAMSLHRAETMVNRLLMHCVPTDHSMSDVDVGRCQ